MSTLSDKDIWNLIEKEELCISPLTTDNIQPGSIDLTLGSTIDVFDAGKVDVNISKEGGTTTESKPESAPPTPKVVEPKVNIHKVSTSGLKR